MPTTKKQPNILDLAMRVKQRTLNIKDIPEAHRAAVNRQIVQGERELIVYMRQRRAPAAEAPLGPRPQVRYVGI